MNKYRAQKHTVDGIAFDSKAEASRWSQLLLLQRAKSIRGLGRQPVYALVVNGRPVAKYTADFAYFEGGRPIVEDVKGGPIRQADSLRMRIFMACYPDHELRIVDAKGASRVMKQRRVSMKSAA